MAQTLPCTSLRAGTRLMLAILALVLGAPVGAQQVRIRQLNDIAFGTLAASPVDRILTDNICVYSTAASGRYTIMARGSGASNAFTLASGTDTLPYEVQWAFSSGQSSGSALTPDVAVSGTTSNRNNSTCGTNQLTASLIVILRSAAQGSATAGNYTGTLTLLVAPN